MMENPPYLGQMNEKEIKNFFNEETIKRIYS